jgi:hypothetical protein
MLGLDFVGVFFGYSLKKENHQVTSFHGRTNGSLNKHLWRARIIARV